MPRSQTGDERLMTELLALRMSAADRARIDALVTRFPLFKPATLARAAMLLGLAIIEEQPTVLLGEKPKARARTRK